MQLLPMGLRCMRAAFAAWGTLPTCAAHSATGSGLRSATYVLLNSSPFQGGRSLQHFVSSIDNPSSSGSSSGNPSSSDSPSSPSSNSSKNLSWLPDPSAATASRSAKESFKAASQAELDALQAVGLNLFTAEAVRAAWYSGRLKKFANVPKAYHSSSSPKQVMSPKQLLVRIRRIIRAHAAAVASAAADPAPVLQQPAVSSRRRVAVQIPHETVQFSEDAVSSMAGLSAMGGLMQAGAAAGSADTAGRQLGWADINIQRILTVDPVLALVPVEDLQSRLAVLLNGIATMLGRDLAVGYVQRSPQLRSMISAPHEAVQHLQACHQAYVEVVGVPPRAALLAASESSHMARLTVPTFRRKLEQFVKRWGAQTAHATLSDQPHLLSSKSSVLDSNGQTLQQLLGCSDKEMQRVVRKAPRVLNTDTRRIANNLAELTNTLHPVGLEPADVRKLVLKLPALIVANPVTVASKLGALKELLGPVAHRLRITVIQQPSLLASSTQTVAGRLDDLKQLLGCDRLTVLKAFVKTPTLGAADINKIAKRLQELTAVLGMSLSDVKVLCCREPNLMAMRPELIRHKLDLWARSLVVDQSAVVNTIISYPLMLTYDAEVIAAHMQMLQTLVPRGSVWGRWRTSHSKTGRGPHSRNPQFSGADMGEYTYPLDRPGWQAFHWEAKAALQEEHDNLSGPELRALIESHWVGYKEGYQRQAQLGRCEEQQQQEQQQQQQPPDEGPDAGEHVSYAQFMPAALARFKADNPSSTHEQAMEAVQQQYRQQQRQRLQRLQQQQQGQRQQETTLQPSGQANPWPLQYSRNVSGRLLLRLEYLLAAGLQEEVSLSHAFRDTEVLWASKFPDFQGWVQVRLQHLQQDLGSEWPPVLLNKAVKWYAARTKSGSSGSMTAATQARKASAAGRKAAAAARAAAGSSGSGDGAAPVRRRVAARRAAASGSSSSDSSSSSSDDEAFDADTALAPSRRMVSARRAAASSSSSSSDDGDVDTAAAPSRRTRQLQN